MQYPQLPAGDRPLKAGAPISPFPELDLLSRRTLLQLLSAAVAGGSLLAVLPGCSQKQIEELGKLLEKIRNRRVRKSLTSLAADDPILTTYAEAVEKMKSLPTSDRRNWINQANIHLNFCRHRSWLVWPWHRVYLTMFEDICIELTGDESFAVPYWDWTGHPQIPAPFWDTSSPLYHSGRTATAASSASPLFVGQPVIDYALDEPNFELFAGSRVPLNFSGIMGPGSGPLESGPHNYIHPFVGGDMGTFVSPLDPIFWTHHCRMDELWVEWNIIRGHPNTNSSDWTDTNFTEFVDRTGQPASVNVGLTILYPLLVYRYDTQV